MRPSNSARDRLRELRPFALVGALGLLLAPLAGSDLHVTKYVAAAGLMVAVGLSSVLLPWPRLPRPAPLGPAILYLLAVALLRDAVGARAGMGVLVLLAVAWMALYGSPRDLTAVVVGVAVVWTAPLVFAGAPRYPSGDWSACALFVAISAMLGATVQRLVRQVREHAGELEQRDSERASLLARVETLAATDPLTGLPNRRTWNERLERELADRRHRPVCLAALDLDHFKPLNDTHGHEAGDRALCAIAAAWRRELRPDDTLARLGGDEFAVLLPDCDVAEGERVIERLRRATCAGLTCSAGVALWNGEESARELQARADELLYDAKRRGGDRLAAAPEGGAFSLSKR